MDKLEYRRIHLKGSFIYKNQFAIRMRGRFDSAFSHIPQGLVADSKSSSHGGHIITPMLLEGSKLVEKFSRKIYFYIFSVVVMVNRGWLPREQIDVELQKGKNLPDSEVKELDAILRLPESVCFLFKFINIKD